MVRKAYPSGVSDEEWAFAAPYLTVMTEGAPQRNYLLREVFNGLRWLARTGAPWRLIPHDLPRQLEQVVIDNGATPATIAIPNGTVHVRLEPHEFINSQVHRSPCRIRTTFADQSFMLYYVRCQTRLSRRS